MLWLKQLLKKDRRLSVIGRRWVRERERGQLDIEGYFERVPFTPFDMIGPREFRCLGAREREREREGLARH